MRDQGGIGRADHDQVAHAHRGDQVVLVRAQQAVVGVDRQGVALAQVALRVALAGLP